MHKSIKRKINPFYKMMKEYLNKNFFLGYRKYLIILGKSFIGKLEST